ncbi:MAG: esterase [Rhizobiales bacterium]|nr:esterase [Rhizobacter sp.]
MHTSALAHLPENGPPELLYLLFHGVGATADSMLPLAQRLIREYPQAAVLCLNAPDRFDAVAGETEARQWFSIRRVDETNRPSRAAAALPAFIATVRALQQRFGMTWERTALAGFSQGAVMALEAVQAEPMLAGRVLAFSGRHATAPAHVPTDTTVHLFHGLADTVIPAAAAIDSAQTLLELGADVTADVLPGIAHELHPLLIEKSIEQLRTFLPRKLWREAMSEAPLLPRAASSDELGG